MADEVRKFFEIFVKEGNVVLHRAIKSFKMSDTVVDALHSIDPKLIDKEHLPQLEISMDIILSSLVHSIFVTFLEI